ncbi:MAG: hypothetical protein H8K09_13155 [Nitrospira sp.]|nr:hypothetical protein [Nitrospira sp.]
MTIRLAMVLIGVLVCADAQAQTVLQVPYDAAVIAWQPAVTPAPTGVGETRWYAMNCGAGDLRIDLPASSVPVKTVAPKPGKYSCTLWAVNNFGKSLPATVPAFDAGYLPATPDNVRIEVR